MSVAAKKEKRYHEFVSFKEPINRNYLVGPGLRYIFEPTTLRPSSEGSPKAIVALKRID